MKNQIRDILLGVAVGDALGVPYEFSNRFTMQNNPAVDMVGYKAHHQPIGTWSDDSSLTFCLAEAMLEGYSLKNTAIKFVQWKDEAYWTARGSVFDIGITTRCAINRLSSILGTEEQYKTLVNLKYDGSEDENGNGSLMRIAPLLLEVKGKSLTEQFDLVWKNSALTHRHIRAAMCCMVYLKMMEHISNELDKWKAYDQTRQDIALLWQEMEFAKSEQKYFQNIIEFDISDQDQHSIKSSGYVIDSLGASLWCFLTTNSYKDAVLTAVNLGEDTDTTAAITGGMAGLYYSVKNIPSSWLVSIARADEIAELGDQLNEKYKLLR